MHDLGGLGGLFVNDAHYQHIVAPEPNRGVGKLWTPQENSHHYGESTQNVMSLVTPNSTHLSGHSAELDTKA